MFAGNLTRLLDGLSYIFLLQQIRRRFETENGNGESSSSNDSIRLESSLENFEESSFFLHCHTENSNAFRADFIDGKTLTIST